MMPSDDDIATACKSLGWDLDAQEEADMILLVRTVMSRYSSDRPAKVRCNHCGWHGADADLVRDVAADEPEDGAADVCPQCKRIGDLQDIGLPAASAEPDLIRAIRELTSHLADVLPDDAWDQIDVKKWNDLTQHVGIAELAERRAKAAPVAQEPVAWVRPDLVVNGKIQASSFTAHTNYRDGYVPLSLAAPVAARAAKERT